MVSSGMAAYQIKKNSPNEMYAQKIRKPNISLPRSCMCSVLISSPTKPARFHASVVTMIAANDVTAEDAKMRTPNMVEYQPGSSDITQSKPAKVSENANRMVAAGATRCSCTVSCLSPVRSCATDLPNSVKPSHSQMPK